jgi:hypothetical protein
MIDPAFEWPGPGESSTYVAEYVVEAMYDTDRNFGIVFRIAPFTMHVIIVIMI